MSTKPSEIKLTHFSRGAGCGCKIAPQVLREILGTHSEAIRDPRLIVGNEGNEDAAVYDLGNGQHLVFTSDFFMPIVDDAYDFGRIAAANALSDVYAMGGKPALALALLGWPVDKLPATLAGEVMRGAREICEQAGISLAGGHSIDSAEPLFGLAVNGLVTQENLKRNNTAKAGDWIYLTKAIGTGIMSTALKRGLLKTEHYTVLISQMTELNRIGEELGKLKFVTSMTDVTGFGLLGHLLEMMKGAGTSAELRLKDIPQMEGLSDYLKQNIFPDASFRNWNAYQADLKVESGVDATLAFQLLPDPQTNGGLLFTVRPESEAELKALLSQHRISAKVIGRVTESGEKTVRLL